MSHAWCHGMTLISLRGMFNTGRIKLCTPSDMTTDSDFNFLSSIDPARLEKLRAGVPVVDEICADLELLTRELETLRNKGCSRNEPVHQQTQESYSALVLELEEHLRREEIQIKNSIQENHG